MILYVAMAKSEQDYLSRAAESLFQQSHTCQAAVDDKTQVVGSARSQAVADALRVHRRDGR